MKPFDFSSVHDYLDLIFKDCSPNESEIIEAKKIYWRAYNTDLKRRQRKLFSIFQIRLNKNEVDTIKSRLKEGQSISKYLFKIISNHLNNYSEVTESVNTALIEQQLFLISEYLKELIEYEHFDESRLTVLEMHIRTLEKVILDTL